MGTALVDDARKWYVARNVELRILRST